MLEKRDSWSPGKRRKEGQETRPRKGKSKPKRKRSTSQTPLQGTRKASQERNKNPVLTPMLKKRKPGNKRGGSQSQEMEEGSEELTPVRKLIKERKLVATKLKRLEERRRRKKKENQQGRDKR